MITWVEQWAADSDTESAGDVKAARRRAAPARRRCTERGWTLQRAAKLLLEAKARLLFNFRLGRSEHLGEKPARGSAGEDTINWINSTRGNKWMMHETSAGWSISRIREWHWCACVPGIMWRLAVGEDKLRLSLRLISVIIHVHAFMAHEKTVWVRQITTRTQNPRQCKLKTSGKPFLGLTST